MGIQSISVERIISQLLASGKEVEQIIQQSFLSNEAKTKYQMACLEKVRRSGMTIGIDSQN